MHIQPLSGEQTRRLIDSEQRYEAYLAIRDRLRHSFRGSMHWKTVGAQDYLYHKVEGVSKSLGPRSDKTQQIYNGFRAGRADLQQRKTGLSEAIRKNAPVDRAMGLGRVPEPVAKILRRIDEQGLLGHGISVVGTNALFAYERSAGGHFESSMLATGDVDLLLDARRRLRLIGPTASIDGLAGILRKVDNSFRPVTAGAFRAINDSGLMVDLIEPMPRAASRPKAASRVGSDDSLHAIEIEGLQWLQNAPQFNAILVDERGFPLRMSTPDPRAFALHKLWLSERKDRDPLKAARDHHQSIAVAQLVQTYLPALSFEDDTLSALPLELRNRAPELLAEKADENSDSWE